MPPKKHPLELMKEEAEKKEKHERELRKAFQHAYLDYVAQGGPIYFK